MGAGQSSHREGQGQDQDQARSESQTNTDYYELLGVDQKATEEEIKKAYRKKALELHPDRNYGNVEASTLHFTKIQSAYEVLSDPQERAWYDSHRDAVLYSDVATPPAGQRQEGWTSRGTTPKDIFRVMTRINGDYSDSPDGFFGILRTAFTTIAHEERIACNWEGLAAVDYPSFGRSSDDYADVVRPFYAVWMSFSTKKSFSWVDIYRPREGSDRRERRMVEKENKRLRDVGIQEYNDAVRAMVAFVRKRDPRYIPNTQTEEERQKVLRNAAAAQAARSRADYQAKLDRQTQPDWVKPQEADEPEEEEQESEQEVEEHFGCVACGKTFKSRKQFEVHETSKKHVKAVRSLQRQMEKENEALNLDRLGFSADDETASATSEMMTGNESIDLEAAGHSEPDGGSTKTTEELADTGNQETQKGSPNEYATHSMKAEAGEDEENPDPAVASESDEAQDEYAPRHEVESRILGNEPTGVLTDNANDPGAPEAYDSDLLSENTTKLSLQEAQGETPSPKMGKAKQKRAKKAAQKGGAAQASNEFICARCHENFPSKTKMFDHIKELNHAQPVTKPSKASSSRGSNGKKR
ncbi:MAG: hypothetical protein M1816_006793 [Peltula sp. TS41687]|nr:MAG: hypothetical protein M1816_006793 [Peltula sp. TS41687]